MAKKSFFPEDPIKPMSVTNTMYLGYTYKFDSQKDAPTTNEDESKNSTSKNRVLELEGIWMLFLDKSVIPIERGMTKLDYAWQFMMPLVDDYENTGIIEVCSSTAYTGWVPADPDSTDGVITCHTRDYRDKRDVKRAADAIRKVFYYPRAMYYKTTAATIAGVYKCFGHRNFSTYKHTLENEMFERDSRNWWRPVIYEDKTLF